MLVICRFKKEAQALATCLECECYYSDIGTTADKAAILARWLGGEYQIICGTKGLATGLDHPSIRIVFFIGPPDDALELVQGMGRAGREGTKRSICQILLDADWKVPDINTDGQFMDTNQRTISYCLDGGRCRKQALSQYMDGVPYTCESNTIGRNAEGAPYVPCDYCLNRPTRQPSPPAAEALPADDQAATLDLQAPIVAVPEVERLQVHVRDRARAREEFLQGLQALHGQCLLCQVLLSESFVHPLDACPRRGRFFDWKKAVAKRKKDWIAPYGACFGCYLPQEICANQGRKGSDNRFDCEFRDMLLPLAMALWETPSFRAVTLLELAGKAFIDEIGYFLWLGERREWCGWAATNILVVAMRWIGDWKESRELERERRQGYIC